MDKTKRDKLEARGWKVGTAEEFLGLTKEEAAYVELNSIPSDKEGLTWDRILLLGQTSPAVHAALATQEQNGLSREQTLILMVIVLNRLQEFTAAQLQQFHELLAGPSRPVWAFYEEDDDEG